MKVKETENYRFELHEMSYKGDTDTLIIYYKSKTIMEKDAIEQVRCGKIAKEVFNLVDGEVVEK